MTTKTYNGWTNYETWAVALWLDNDEQSQGYWQAMAAEALKNPGSYYHKGFTAEEMAAIALADSLKADHEEALPELSGFASDLLNAAMSEVNWHEIAKEFVAQAVEEAAGA